MGWVDGAVEFVSVQPTERDYLRGVVLFGRNVASYKFALALAILDLAAEGRTSVPLTDLAGPFARNVCRHLELAPKQATSASSRFLDTCRRANRGEIDNDDLIAATTRLGFNNVIDAFHVVGPSEIPVRFFDDARRSAVPSIVLTDAIHHVAAAAQGDAGAEVEARWRLVETAWDLGATRSVMAYDTDSGLLVTDGLRRKSVTSAAPALNGYQKGRCFYCYRPIGIGAIADWPCEVDHLFPHVLQRLGLLRNLDGVWNLVLACERCNGNKSDRTPAARYVGRLDKRNEYLIDSSHPLRETLMLQTGATRAARRAFLQEALTIAGTHQVSTWQTEALGDPTF